MHLPKNFTGTRSAESLSLASRKHVWLAGLLIAVSAGIAYSNSLNGPFLFDDQGDIERNTSIRHPEKIWQIFGSSDAPTMSVHSRPVVVLSFAANYACAGLGTRPYHITNLAIHILAGLTLFGIVRRTLSLPSMVRFAEVSTPLALAIALVWTLHPLQTQAVTYIVQRYESLMGLFYLLTLYAAIRASTGSHSGLWMITSIAACLLALGCKEVAVSAPILVFLYDRAFMAGSFREAWRRRWPLYSGLAGTWLIFLPFYFAFSGRGFTGSVTGHTWLEYARSQPGVVLHYLRLCVWPQGQCLDYRWPVAQTVSQIFPQSTVILALLAVTAWLTAVRPQLGFLGAWFFLILAPTSSVMPILDLAFEHRMYLSLAAVAVALVVTVYELTPHWPGNRCRFILAVLVVAPVCVLGSLTFMRNRVYSSVLATWDDVAANSPRNARAQIGIGVGLVQSGQHAAALGHFEEAGQLKADYIDVADFQNNWAACLVQLNRGDEAIPHFLIAQQMKPNDYTIHLNLAVLFAAHGRKQAALSELHAAVEHCPTLATGRLDTEVANPAGCAAMLAYLAQTLGGAPKTLLAQPLDNCLAECEYGAALARAGQYEMALARFDAATKLQPGERLAREIQEARTQVTAELRRESPTKPSREAKSDGETLGKKEN